MVMPAESASVPSIATLSSIAPRRAPNEARPDPNGPPLLLEDPSDRLDGPTGAHDPSGRLVEGDSEILETNPRPAIGDLGCGQHLIWGSQRIPMSAGVLDVLAGVLPEDEITGVEEHPG